MDDLTQSVLLPSLRQDLLLKKLNDLLAPAHQFIPCWPNRENLGILKQIYRSFNIFHLQPNHPNPNGSVRCSPRDGCPRPWRHLGPTTWDGGQFEELKREEMKLCLKKSGNLETSWVFYWNQSFSDKGKMHNCCGICLVLHFANDEGNCSKFHGSLHWKTVLAGHRRDYLWPSINNSGPRRPSCLKGDLNPTYLWIFWLWSFHNINLIPHGTQLEPKKNITSYRTFWKGGSWTSWKSCLGSSCRDVSIDRCFIS